MTDTLSYKPSYTARLTKKPKVLEAKFGDGYSQRVRDGINTNLQTWALTFAGVTDSRADAIMGFFDTQGGTDKFSWVPPGFTSLYFICKDYQRSYNGEDLNEITATLEQVP